MGHIEKLCTNRRGGNFRSSSNVNAQKPRIEPNEGEFSKDKEQQGVIDDGEGENVAKEIDEQLLDVIEEEKEEMEETNEEEECVNGRLTMSKVRYIFLHITSCCMDICKAEK
jgi:hypothetical protein